MSEPLVVRRDGAVAHVVLSRPEVRNAFDAALIGRVHVAFAELGSDASVRAIVLSGAGATFCGGADVNWMRASLELSHADNLADAAAMSRMFRAIDGTPKLVVARVHGAALGGGAGLAAVCDVVVASDDAIFGFTETRLGLLPAVISPFVLAKIGPSHARALALTGERFGAARALAIGLVHEVRPAADVDAAVDRILGEIVAAAPLAVARTKALFRVVREASYDASLELTAAAIAEQRTGAEGQAGLRSFLERRPAPWREAAGS